MGLQVPWGVVCARCATLDFTVVRALRLAQPVQLGICVQTLQLLLYFVLLALFPIYLGRHSAQLVQLEHTRSPPALSVSDAIKAISAAILPRDKWPVPPGTIPCSRTAQCACHAQLDHSAPKHSAHRKVVEVVSIPFKQL